MESFRGSQMRRREFIAGLGSAAAWPLTAWAQQPALPLIGYLGSQSADDSKVVTVPFLQGLKETGYVEGQNVAIEYRWAEKFTADERARWVGLFLTGNPLALVIGGRSQDLFSILLTVP